MGWPGDVQWTPLPSKDSDSCSQGGFFLAVASVARLLDFGNSLQRSGLGHAAEARQSAKSELCRRQIPELPPEEHGYSHFIHLHVLLIQRELQVRVIGRRPELVSRQHEEDESGQLYQKLKTTGKGEDDRRGGQKRQGGERRGFLTS